MNNYRTLPLTRALTIATSDSGGGAGVQADLKTFAAFGVYGLSVLSGVSAQNTMAVTGLECLSPGLVTSQLKAIFDDMGAEAIKIGLIGNAENAEAIAGFLATLSPRPPVILDPVMVSASGHAFLEVGAVAGLKALYPYVTLLTPNIPEAEALSGLTINGPDDCLRAGQAILESGLERVLIKGGHLDGEESNDLLVGPNGANWFNVGRVRTKNNHGTGCTLSSAIAACLALGKDLESSVKYAKLYVAGALENSIDLGQGPGPLNHFFNYYRYGEPGA
ncbi:MAG: bifunctional hydroxymethylpyrimidine kinase/phosphomethylpyrimidine kinase [Deltaproteobacteria bacterium]|jgi:hydroxymethylpyrimidine/phosphomethylpyrimidine kinase|nr:bifunctional hydroxymethylpyrimidine kinase/phosphomethylpyrimidine kinase [Deltaproteobacteria bacterium]